MSSVLIVDDDDASRFALRALLEAHGWSVVESRNGDEAMERLREGPHPAAILLDLMMPDANGWAFRRKQLAAPELANIPVIILSGLNDPPGLLGTAAFVRKPIDNDRLIAALERAVGGRERKSNGDILPGATSRR
jgi:CheY-like chemotaxis protein